MWIVTFPGFYRYGSEFLLLIDMQIDAVPDLRDHVYKAVARMLLNVGG